jgi:hypothetical protein
VIKRGKREDLGRLKTKAKGLKERSGELRIKKLRIKRDAAEQLNGGTAEQREAK